jgi:predicted permease
MTSDVLAFCLSFVLVAVPGAVCWLALRRFGRSRSRNAALYALAGCFALTAAAGAAWTGPSGASGVMAAASLPLWLLVRRIAARRRWPPPGPVFASARRGGLRGRARGLRREA